MYVCMYVCMYIFNMELMNDIFFYEELDFSRKGSTKGPSGTRCYPLYDVLIHLFMYVCMYVCICKLFYLYT